MSSILLLLLLVVSLMSYGYTAAPADDYHSDLQSGGHLEVGSSSDLGGQNYGVFSSDQQDMDVEKFMPPENYRPRVKYSYESLQDYQIRLIGARQRYEESRRQLRKQLVKVAHENENPSKLPEEMQTALENHKRKIKKKKAYDPELQIVGSGMQEYEKLCPSDPRREVLDKRVRYIRNMRNKTSRYRTKYWNAPEEQKDRIIQKAIDAGVDVESIKGGLYAPILPAIASNLRHQMNTLGEEVHQVNQPEIDLPYEILESSAHDDRIPDDWLSLAPPGNDEKIGDNAEHLPLHDADSQAYWRYQTQK